VRWVAADTEFRQVFAELTPAGHDGLVTGTSGSARHLFYAALYVLLTELRPNRTLLVVTHNAAQAAQIADDLREFLPGEPVWLYPERELSVVDAVAYSRDVIADRLRVLQHLASGQGGVVVSTIASTVQPVLGRALFDELQLVLREGQRLPLAEAAAALLRSGYERTDLVESPGHFAQRGGILDVYPLAADKPLRIEWFDDEIDSIRSFEPDTQRSVDRCKEVRIGPALDYLVAPARMQAAAEQLQAWLEERIRLTPDLELRERLQTVVGEDVRKMAAGLPFFGLLRYEQLLGERTHTLLDYVAAGSVVGLDEPTRLQERQRGLEREFREWLASGLLRGELAAGALREPVWNLVWEHRGLAGIEFSVFARGGGQRYRFVHNVTTKPMQQFHGQMNVLKAEVQRWQNTGMQVVFTAASAERADRLERVLADYRIDAVRSAVFTPGGRVPQIVVANVSAGFELPLQRLVVVAETEVFAAKKKARRDRARQELSDAERIRSYQELRPGDYVVHVNHGIGKYLGIRTLEIDGKHKDYLHLQYAGNDSLYVPVEQIDQVQRYVGAEDKDPKLSSLG
ncbi:MAG: transcription-repair coupling factor, partial [Alicyclobacillus sp.]|nr:transcription-repair coupling factor [Alicyclobacillus sp.]